MIADYGLILDGLIVVLLCATVVYAAALNRRIARLRDNRVELELATRTMADAAAKADAGIKGLRLAAGSVGAAMHTDIEQARSLRDELAFLVEAGEAMAGRLEAAASGAARAARSGRTAAGGDPPVDVERTAPTGKRTNAAGRARRELMKAIENLR